MAKLICLTIFAFLVVGGSSLKCYTYKCESRNGRNCSANTDLKHLTCGIPGTGYQSICSYVATLDTIDDVYVIETACNLVPTGILKDQQLRRCINPDAGEKVVFCNICNTDLCNTPPRR